MILCVCVWMDLRFISHNILGTRKKLIKSEILQESLKFGLFLIDIGLHIIDFIFLCVFFTDRFLKL